MHTFQILSFDKFCTEALMAIKQPKILTRQELDQAMVHLRLNISEVSRETSIPRTYLSEFRNGDRQLRPENLAKLRDYFEGKGLEFEEEQVTETATPSEAITPIELQTDLPGIQRAVLALRHLAIDPSITHEQVEAILEKITANDREAEELLGFKAESGLFSDWSEATDATLKGVFGLFAANYVLLRHLQGRPLVMLANPVEYDDIKTVADIFAHLFHEENAALVANQEIPDSAPGEEEVEA
jgi:hypothetical protein